MRDNMSLLGYISIALFLLFLGAPMQVSLPNGTTLTLYLVVLLPLSYVIIDYAIKAFREQFYNESREINLLSKILNVVFLGIPWMLYCYFVLTFKVIDKDFLELGKKWLAIILLGILSLGIVPLSFLIFISFGILVDYIITGNTFIYEENKLLFFVSLLVGLVVTLGTIVVFFIVHVFMLKMTLIVKDLGKRDLLKWYDYILIILLLITSGGMLFLMLVLIYYMYELVVLDLFVNVSEEDRVKLDAFHDVIKERNEG